jgi:hypothetical protein
MRVFEVIRLSAKKPSGPASTFINALRDAYPNNTAFSPDELLVDGGGVKVSVDKWLGGDVMIDDLRAVEQGGGHRAITALCGLADQHSVALTLVASPYDSVVGKTMELGQLISWYERFGFAPIGDYGGDYDGYDQIEMIRRPGQ